MKSKKSKVKVKNPKQAGKLNALLEIGLEEVPSRFMPGILADLKAKADKALTELRLGFRSVETLGTPRRLVLYISGLPPRQDDISREVKGPSREAAYGGNGTPTKAAEGFAKSQGVSISDLKVKKFGEREFVFATVTEKGLETRDVLKDMFPRLMLSLFLPISMRWGDVEHKFIRPIHWIFAACGSGIVAFSINGVASSNRTYGHRYFSKGALTVSLAKGVDLDDFKKTLLKGSVILDQKERRSKIESLVRAEGKRTGGEVLIDEDLLEEVNYLVEWPIANSGSFRSEFLALPKDVLVTSMKKNQKYFAVIDVSGKLKNSFVNVTNGVKKEDIASVTEGNERVLTARLNDAKFFFEEDRKKTLADLTPGLAKVAFIEKLGSVLEKVERVRALSSWIARELKMPETGRENAERIAELCKSDLLTHMVYEFPSLQGIMGREYSLLEGRSREVAAGIFEHYLPRFAGDILPSSMEGAVVAIADKMDTIVGCFSIDLIPSGSEDPFALRRQAQGIVNVLIDRKLNLALDLLIEKSYKLYEPLFLGELFTSGRVKYNNIDKVIPDALSFIAARLKGSMLEKGVRYDVADAVLAGFEDVLDAFERAAAVTGALKKDWFKGIVMTADRLHRLGVNATRSNVVEHDFAANEEKNIYQLYLKVNEQVTAAAHAGDYASSMMALAQMTAPVDDLFVKVMIMDKDERLKANRLALLKTLERMYLEVADFSKIVM